MTSSHQRHDSRVGSRGGSGLFGTAPIPALTPVGARGEGGGSCMACRISDPAEDRDQGQRPGTAITAASMHCRKFYTG